jgi:hypothetical protein
VDTGTSTNAETDADTDVDSKVPNVDYRHGTKLTNCMLRCSLATGLLEHGPNLVIPH